MANKCQPCNSERCSLCSQIRPGNSFQFNCGFLYIIEDGENLTCKSKDVIYVLKCKTCSGEYIGETVNIRRRIHTHNSHIRTEQHLCRATDHLIECGKQLSDVRERFTVFLLETERDKYVRKAKEAYYIRLFKPMMNK
jgi:predicted GIY-YIG superfamily endonuclease